MTFSRIDSANFRSRFLTHFLRCSSSSRVLPIITYISSASVAHVLRILHIPVLLSIFSQSATSFSCSVHACQMLSLLSIAKHQIITCNLQILTEAFSKMCLLPIGGFGPQMCEADFAVELTPFSLTGLRFLPMKKRGNWVRCANLLNCPR